MEKLFGSWSRVLPVKDDFLGIRGFIFTSLFDTPVSLGKLSRLVPEKRDTGRLPSSLKKKLDESKAFLKTLHLCESSKSSVLSRSRGLQC